MVTPYYNKPTQDGLVAHFKALHDACDLPIIIYNIPGRSVVDMMPDTMARLAELPRIIGVKDATGKLERVSLQRMACGPDFIQLSGEDATAPGFNAQGGVGCISVTANVAPRLCAEFQEATLAGDYARALELHDRLDAAARRDFRRAGAGWREIWLARLGKCREDVRLPLLGLTDTAKRAWTPRCAMPGCSIKRRSTQTGLCAVPAASSSGQTVVGQRPQTPGIPSRAGRQTATHS